MPFGWRESMAAIAALFFVFLLFKMRPSARRNGELAAEVKAARDRASTAKTPRAAAEALCEAGRLAADHRTWSASAGLFLRAMNADSTWPDAVAQAAMALAPRRPALLEKLLWQRLELCEWDDEHAAALSAAAVALAGLYEGKLRDATRARVMQRLAHRLQAQRPIAHDE